MPVSKSLRFEVLRRDRFRCSYCGAGAPEVTLHVDHIVPESLGGPNTPDNLTTACQDCNTGKAGRTLDDEPASNVDKRIAEWSAAIQQAMDENRAELQEREEKAIRFARMWNEWTPTPPLGDGYEQSINRFMDFGLDWRTIEELISVAMRSRANDTWLYFCGCCNRRIDDLRARAMKIMEGNDA